MKPRITLITLGVDDLERAVAFYRDGLACRPEALLVESLSTGRSPSLTSSPA